MAFVVKPSKKNFEELASYLKKLADEQGDKHGKYGIVELTYQDILDNTGLKETISNAPRLSGFFSYLRENNYVTRVRRGTRLEKALWDVNNLISPNQTEQPELEVVDHSSSELNHTEDSISNDELLKQIHNSISDMIGYLQTLPIEMGGHLKHLTEKLDATAFEQQKKQLETRISTLEFELEQAKKSHYSEHTIVRQNNLILDEVERMLTIPAWQLNKNKQHYRQSITEKLDRIMHELKIDKVK